jgi:hypothetical protein
MELIDQDEAYIRIAHAIIEQAVTDYRDLTRMAAIRRDGSINADFWSRRDYGKGYRRPKHLPAPSWAKYLIEFLQGPDLDFLCDLTGFKACRIRRELGIEKGE